MQTTETSQTTGNRCGHNKVNPRWFIAPQKHKERPKILIEAAEKVTRFYEKHDHYLPALRYVNDSYQQQRSERREAAGAVLQVLLHYTDLNTLHVGTPKTSGEINGLRIKFIGNKLGFGDKRVWRAMHDLKKAGYLRIQTRLIKSYGNIFSQSTIIVHPKTFHDLGIGQLKLKMSRHYKYQSQSKKAVQQPLSQILTPEEKRSGRRQIKKIGQFLKGTADSRTLKHKAEIEQHQQDLQKKRIAIEHFALLSRAGWKVWDIKAHLNAPEDTTINELYDKLQRNPLPEKS